MRPGAAVPTVGVSCREKEPDVASTITIQNRRRELAHRVSNGIEVTLFWGPATGEVIVDVVDHGADYGFELTVPSECALDAFHHPYAYAAHQGVEYEANLPQAA
jgi:hypothetical protein